MYATAHRVKSARGVTGINSFLHEHGEDSGATSWESPDVAAVADGRTGKLVAESYDVPPGGNAVLSFLAVVAADGTDTNRVSGALGLFKSMVARTPAPVVAVLNGIGMRFGCDLGLAPAATEEFERLESRVLAILSADRTTPTATPEPLDIIVVFNEEGYSFELSPRSAERVREAHQGREWAPARFRVAPDAMMDFQDMHGDIVPQVIADLTQLRLEKVIEMGGARLVNRATLKEIRRWPKSATADGQPLSS